MGTAEVARSGGMPCMTKQLQWSDTASLGRTRLGRWEGEDVLHVRGQLECIGMSDEPAESLWTKIKEQTSVGGIVIDVC